MEVKETYYEILGIDTDAAEDDIRKAYRKQALLWHPDKNTQRREEAEERFKLIAEAYEVLSDTDKKRIYDMYGEEGLKNGGPSHDFGQDFAFQFHDPLDIFNAFFGGRDPFSSMFADPFFDTGFGRPFGFPPFGARPFGAGPFGAGPGSRSLFDNHPFFSNNNGSSSSSSFSFSSNSFSGGGQGGYVKKSTTTQYVNGVRKTVTRTEDAQGNVTVVTETPDGGRQVHVNNQQQALPRSTSDRFNIPIQDVQDRGHQQYRQQHQQQQLQQLQQQQYQQQQQQYQQQQQQQQYQQQQYRQYQPHQQQYQYQQQYQQRQYQEPQEENHPLGHKKHFWHRKK